MGVDGVVVDHFRGHLTTWRTWVLSVLLYDPIMSAEFVRFF